MTFHNLLREALEGATFDSCGGSGKKDDKKKAAATMDEAESAGSYAVRDIQIKAVSAVQQWLETDEADLGDGETLADRLTALMIGIADADKDGEISDDEADVVQVAMNAAWDYLASKGVPEDDCSALFNDGDEAAASRVRDFVAGEVPDGDAADEEIDNFVFSEEDQEPLLDCVGNAVCDAVYKKTFAIRKGKKVRISKRVSGTVRLSAKQKVAIRKAQMKSHSAAAMMRRLKSMKIRKKMGI